MLSIQFAGMLAPPITWLRHRRIAHYVNLEANGLERRSEATGA
jgi:hypothetical protein